MAVELTQGYVSLAMAFDENPGKELEKWLAGVQKQADETGKGMSRALSLGAEGGAAKIKADMARIRRDMEAAASAAKTAREKEEGATRKVAIAEQQLTEARQKGAAKQSQILALEDRLASAKSASTKATMQAAAATDKARQAEEAYAESAKRTARLNRSVLSDSARALRSGNLAEAQRAGAQFGAALGNSAKSAISRINPFQRMALQAGDAGSEAGSRFSRDFQAASKHSMGGAGLAMLAGGAGGIAAMAGGSIVSAIGGGLSGAMEQVDSNQTFAQSLSFAKVSKAQIADLSAQTQSYADRTIYDLAEIRNTTASFAASGVKGAQGFTEALGNLNAVAGGTSETFSSVTMASTQIMGAGKLTAENWNQVRDAIPGGAAVIRKALQEAGAYTGDFNEAMSKGQITAQEYQAAIQKVGMDEVAKKAATSATTFKGAWGSMQATIQGGLAKSLQELQPLFTGATNAMTPLVEKGFSGLAKGIGFVVGLTPRLRAELGQLAGVWTRNASALDGFTSGMMTRLRPLLPAVRQVFAQIGQAVGAYMGAFQATIKVATDAASYIWRRWGDSIMATATAAFRIILRTAQGGLSMLTGIFKLISSMMTGNWSGAWGALKQIASGGWTVLRGIFSAGWLVLRTGFTAGKAVLLRTFDLMWSGIKSIGSAGWSWLKSKTLDPLVDFFRVTIPDAAARARDGFGSAWDGIKRKASQPVKAIVDTVWNGGIVALAKSAGLGDVFKTIQFDGFRNGGFTGYGQDSEYAGPAHKNEYVFDAPVVRAAGGPQAMESIRTALRRGMWPVGPAAEVPGDSQQRPAPLTQAVGPGVPGDLASTIRRGPQSDGGFGGPAEWGMSQQGLMGWYRRCLAFVNAAWGHTIPRLGMATARQSMNAGPLQQGVPPRGAAAYYNTSGYAGHVALGLGDGSVLSNDIVVPGRIDRVPYNIFSSRWGAPYMGYFMPGGGGPGVMSGMWNSTKGGVASAVNKLGQTWDVFKGKIGNFANVKLPGGAPWLDSVKSIPGKLVDVANTKLKSAFDSAFGASVDVGLPGNASEVHNQVAAAVGQLHRSWQTDPSQWKALSEIISHESSWDPSSKNPSSTARGLFQMLYEPGTKTPYGQHDVPTQVRDGLSYIEGRYGDPAGAWDFWQKHQWYDSGGYLQPGSTAVMNGTGSPEPVFTSRQWDSIDRLAGMGATTLALALSQDIGSSRGGPVVVTGELTLTEDSTVLIEGIAQDVVDANAEGIARRNY